MKNLNLFATVLILASTLSASSSFAFGAMSFDLTCESKSNTLKLIFIRAQADGVVMDQSFFQGQEIESEIATNQNPKDMFGPITKVKFVSGGHQVVVTFSKEILDMATAETANPAVIKVDGVAEKALCK